MTDGAVSDQQTPPDRQTPATPRPLGGLRPPASTVPLPTSTAPEQLRLAWGSDPATELTVSWSAPGSVPQPAPALAYSTAPITASRPGRTIALPEPEPLDVTRRYPRAFSVSFTDGLNGQTTYHYHVQLTGLEPGTTYYYRVSDGAAAPSTAGGSFQTAPSGRASFRFSSYGDLATPSPARNASGQRWNQASDNAYLSVSAIEEPGDGAGPPLFHLLNGDLCYANLSYQNAPAVWRDFGINVSRSARNRPWMPALGNHETEFGTCDHAGREGTAPGGIAAQAAAGNYWNGPYGYGHYLSRFLLPDNGLTNYDGNRLRGNFYAFRVGTVQFVSVDADDVIYQDSASGYLRSTPAAAPLSTSAGVRIPNGTITYNHGYTGNLTITAASNSAVPDYDSGQPNLQTIWLERTLAEARRSPDVDMIVVFMHQCALSSSSAGNGSDLGIRQAWLPLFDRYEVDLVLSGHEHNYERSYPVRGYDRGSPATVVAPNPGQAAGAAISTRRPSVAATEPVSYQGRPAWDTQQGTVFLVLGAGGNDGPSNVYGTNPVTGAPRAKVITQRNAIRGSAATGFTRNPADSVEDAPWSAATSPDEPYGYAIFDVDPGERPGETTITFRYFAIPAVSGQAGRAQPDAITLPATPRETFVFGRGISGQPGRCSRSLSTTTA